MKKLTARHFWNWFREHNEDYLTLPEACEKRRNYLLDELRLHLSASGGPPHYTMEVDSITNTAELMFTCNGHPEKTPSIDAFVAAAPRIARWQFHALYPPRPHDMMEDELEELNIRPHQLYCCPIEVEHDDTIWVSVHLDNLDQKIKPILEKIVWQILYNMLGERLFHQEIGAMICEDMDCLEEGDLMPFSDFPAFIARRKSNFVVNKNGCIKKKHARIRHGA